MAKRNVARDHAEIVSFAAGYVGQATLQCIEAYAAKRNISSPRVGRAFWDKVDEGEILVYKAYQLDGSVVYRIQGVSPADTEGS